MVELHTLCMVLSRIEIGDCLSDVQMKTGLSFTTVRKAVSVLEGDGILDISVNKTERGRARECVWISPAHKKAAIFYDGVTSKMSELFSSSNELNPILFEIDMLEKCLGEIKAKIPPETSDIFEEWLRSSSGSIGLDRFTKGEDDDFYEARNDRVFFLPQCFDVRVKCRGRKRERRRITLEDWTQG